MGTRVTLPTGWQNSENRTYPIDVQLKCSRKCIYKFGTTEKAAIHCTEIIRPGPLPDREAATLPRDR